MIMIIYDSIIDFLINYNRMVSVIRMTNCNHGHPIYLVLILVGRYNVYRAQWLSITIP